LPLVGPVITKVVLARLKGVDLFFILSGFHPSYSSWSNLFFCFRIIV
jgi:hypothetical protein